MFVEAALKSIPVASKSSKFLRGIYIYGFKHQTSGLILQKKKHIFDRMVDNNGLLFSSEVNDTAIRAVAANKRRLAKESSMDGWEIHPPNPWKIL